MKFLDIKNISERDMELVNPTSSAKMIEVGQALDLREGMRVIDFGCGYGEMLALWAQRFGISGIGVEFREHGCNRARAKMAQQGLAARVEIVCMDAAQYAFEKGGFDAAIAIGTSFIWNGFGPTLINIKQAIRPGGRVAIGEPYWVHDRIPPEYYKSQSFVCTEIELLDLTRKAGFDLLTIVRSSQDDWDRYYSSEWRALVRGLEENPEHTERQDVVDDLRQGQDEYLRYGREYFGWAVYVLAPRPE